MQRLLEQLAYRKDSGSSREQRAVCGLGQKRLPRESTGARGLGRGLQPIHAQSKAEMPASREGAGNHEGGHWGEVESG